MAKEIERKFLVVNDSYKRQAIGRQDISQGYLSTDPKATVRVRIKDDHAFITVKGLTHGVIRDEWEYEIPISDAKEMLGCCGDRVLSKTRWVVPGRPEGLLWEVDEFHGSLEGLTVSEIELPSVDSPVILPEFVGEEVTGNPRYYNSSLVAGTVS